MKNHFEVFKEFSKKIKISLFLILLFESFNLINPIIFKELIDLLILFDKTQVNKMIFLAASMFGLNVFLSVFYYAKEKYIFGCVYAIKKNIKERVHKKLLNLPISWHENKNIAGQISKIQRGMSDLIHLAYLMICDFFPLLFKILISSIIILYLDLNLGIIFVFFIPIFILSSYKRDKKINPLRKKIHTMDEEAYAKIGEGVENIRTVQSFSQETREINEFEIMQKSLFDTAKFRINLFLKHNLERSMILNIGRVCGLGYGLYLANFGQISPGSFVMFLTISETVYMAIYRLSNSFNQINDTIDSVKRVNDLLKEDFKIPQISRPVKKRIKGNIEFKKVNFCYSPENKVLENITFKIKKGKTFAIVGPSGSGKSTIIKLLYRHFDTTEGKILVDGINIRNYDLSIYRWQMAVVPQEVELFNTTIKKNIAYSNPKATDDEIIKAAKIANINNFIEKLPKKYETIVGEKGLKLSGGQRQRIGIARAIVVKPAILVFDEATSSLDSISEKQIQKALKTISGKYTIIIIAHRLSTIKNADKIIVVENGKIIEQGNHKTLIKKQNGFYKKLYKMQSNE